MEDKPSHALSGTYLSCRLTWACGVALGAWACGGISGGHINPAVTIPMCIFRGFSWRKGCKYIVAQTLGCAFGAFVVYMLYRDSILVYEGGLPHAVSEIYLTAGLFITRPFPIISLMRAYMTELLATAALLFLVLAMSDHGNWSVRRGTMHVGLFFVILAIGSSLGSNTGYALNPARDTGPRIVLTLLGYGSEVWTHDGAYWFFAGWVSTIAGGLLGVFLYDAFLYEGEDSWVYNILMDQAQPISLTT